MTQDPRDRSTAPGNVIAGKLRIVRALGEGGMGAVYEVEHEITRHRRALKLLHNQMAEVPGVVERFLREASAAGRIGNPHIVETFDAGRLDSGEPYIVMELLRGKSLADKLNEAGPLDITTACEILIQTCDGVAAAHTAGIIHRDLKPENLFLVGPDCSYVKILDFGISKFDAAITGVEGFTMEGSPIGTPFYMSPEQVRGQKTVNVGTDVYALGVVLYECLTNHRPFDADNLPHLIYLISQGKFPPPSSHRPSLPRSLDDIVSKALASDPAERFASAKELGVALSRLRQSLAPPSLDAQLPPSPSMMPPSMNMPAGITSGSVMPASMNLTPSTNLTPTTESNRGVPALTPDVFSNSAMMHAQRVSSAPPKRSLYLALGGAALLTLAAAGMGAMLLRSRTGGSASDAPSSAADPMTMAAPPARELPAVVPVNAQANANAASDGAPSQPVSARHQASNPPLVKPTSAATQASSAASANTASAKPPKPEDAGKSKNRAASVGLAEDNPFK